MSDTDGEEAERTAEGASRVAEETLRRSYGRLVAFLASITGDLAAAEDALSDAFVAALRVWPQRGVSGRPESWLLTAARRNLADAARRRAVARRHLPELARIVEFSHDEVPSPIPDRRLELMFACTHPAIEATMRSPLMPQTVLGLDAARIGSAFLVAPSTMGQRLVRVKKKIHDAGVPFRIPIPRSCPSVSAACSMPCTRCTAPAGTADRSPKTAGLLVLSTKHYGWDGCWRNCCLTRPRRTACWP